MDYPAFQNSQEVHKTGSHSFAIIHVADMELLSPPDHKVSIFFYFYII